MRMNEVVTRSKLNTEDEQLKAVSHNGHIIRFITNPSKDVQLAAMKQNGYALQHIKDQSSIIQMAAISSDPSAIEFIDRIDPALLRYLSAKEIIITALLKFIKEATDDVHPVDSVKNVSMRFIGLLRQAGCKWPELDIIEKSVRSLSDPQMDDDAINEVELQIGFNPQKILYHIP